MVKDPISNLIVKIKNASRAKSALLASPYSKMTEAILTVLKKEGFIQDFSKKANNKKIVKEIEVVLAYDENGASKVEDVKRISKLSKRVYKGSKELKPVRSGFGMLVLSTPKGVLSDKEAREQNVGGEVLFKIW